MNKKKIIIALVVVVIGLYGYGIYSLSRVIVDNSYSSRQRLADESKNDDTNDTSDYVVVQSPTESGDEGAYSEDDVELSTDEEYELYKNKSAYGKLKELLTKSNSPYDFESYSVLESKSNEGETILDVYNGNTIILSVYCDTVSNTPYCFVSGTSGFSDKENEYISSLGNGQYTRRSDGSEVWLFY